MGCLRWVTLTLALTLFLTIGVPLAQSQNSTSQIIESHDPSVDRTGNWTSQAAKDASGGSYLYSSGAEGDVLTLLFSSPSIEVIYITGPSLGTLAIEIDGTVMRTVITTSETTQFRQIASVNYLTNESHTAKIYAQSGSVIAVDAFIIHVVSATPPEDISSSGTARFTSDLVAVAVSDSRINLSWTDTLANETEFIVERSPDGVGNWLEIGRAAANSTSYVNVSLYCGTVYYFRVRAVLIGGGFSGDSNIANAATSPCRANCDTTSRIRRASESSTGDPSNFTSNHATISGDGRFVAFQSIAHNLVPNDTIDSWDVFVRDMQTCQIWLVSLSSTGEQANQPAYADSIRNILSPNGRYVLFASRASNLIIQNTPGNNQIYVHDRLLGQTNIVSVNNAGVPVNSSALVSARDVSNTGQVIFTTDATNFDPYDPDNFDDVYIRDVVNHTTTLVSLGVNGQKGNGSSSADSITPDGRYITISSDASNLVVGDTNNVGDIFVRDLQLNTISRVSVGSNGQQADNGSGGGSISDDGRYVAFYSYASLVLPDTNPYLEVYVHDRQTGITTRPATPAIGLQANEATYPAIISGDGRTLIFEAIANNLYFGDTNGFDVIMVDLQTGHTSVVNQNAYGTPSKGWARIGGLSYDGSLFVFNSNDPDLVTPDPNGTWDDVFVVRRPTKPALTLFRSDYNATSQLNTLVDLPQLSGYNSFTLYPPPGGYNGQWVMGDWNGDGLRTPGVYANNGVFYITNQSGGPGSSWLGTWFGLYGHPPVVGRFANVPYDCLGVMDSAYLPPYGTAFALYYTCNLSGGAPPLSFQWISVVLPDPTFSGTHQFVAGDFNGDGLDSVAVRRGEFIAFTNVAPSMGHAVYDLAQYWGIPPNTAGDEGVFVVGDWNLDNQESFGVFYQNGYFYRRDDMQWNTGIYILQRVGQPIGAPVSTTTWRPQ